MTNQELVARARKSYRSLSGVVVVSPRLIDELADALDATEGSRADPTPLLTESVIASALEHLHERFGLTKFDLDADYGLVLFQQHTSDTSAIITVRDIAEAFNAAIVTKR